MEIQFGVGGEDAKLFVAELFQAYERYFSHHSIEFTLVSREHGFISAKLRGHNVATLFQREVGKHCVQRVSTTESRGRVHTSIVTVSVLPIRHSTESGINESDVQFLYKRGSGPGGQAKNKLSVCVDARHIPTGLRVTIDGRSQLQNKMQALQILEARLRERSRNQRAQDDRTLRRQQRGDAGRSDKVRTYNFPRGEVIDHRSGRKSNLKAFLKGGIAF